MVKLEDIAVGAQLRGIEPGQAVGVVQVVPVGEDALTLIYKNAAGQLGERMLFRSEEAALELIEAGRAWAFTAPGADFRLAAEAYRIQLAHLFDPMMAVHTSDVEPLPHQITAVYDAMLPRQPLRYVLADDPGAGKTIMAGLLIRELMLRGDVARCLVVAPGNLVEQWQDEMGQKFGLHFTLLSRDRVASAPSGNPFTEHPLLIARLDQLSRNEDLQAKLQATEWDLVIVDEAHKLSATWFGAKLNETQRYKLGQRLGRLTRHFVLMTATPHNGKEADFQLFLALLDADRFYGRFRDGVHKVDVSDLMRRLVKEELLKFDGTPLFPERRAYTVNYRLADAEVTLYEAVTRYVKEEMNRADQLDDRRKGTVGFALTVLQRRLASSPEAIYQSLHRRRLRLERRLEEEQRQQRAQRLSQAAQSLKVVGGEDFDAYLDEAPEGELEELEEELVDQATAARTSAELQAEILSLKALELQAHALRISGKDCKWDQLSRLLQDTPEMRHPDGGRRKLILFTEHRDTLTYLAHRIRGLLGHPEAVITIHGGTHREERRTLQTQFRNDPTVLVLVATDAAGEGVNLQNANLMVNYDLPWNPNRIEQRFGRIHRIGQTEVCHLWNLVARETREGDVFQRLFEKLEKERESLGGRVFDILGEVFEERPLRELLIDAIRYGDDPQVKARLHQQVEGALDTAHLKAILSRNALTHEIMSPEQLYAVKEAMEMAEARKLQPFFIRAWFTEAFARLGGELRQREPERYEIKHVPAVIRERDRVLGAREPVVRRYERVCFDRRKVRQDHKPLAALIHPGHPLMAALLDLTLERHRPALKEGAVLVDPADEGSEPRLLFFIEHALREGGTPGRLASQRLHFVEIDPQGRARNAGFAPYLDYAPLDPADRPLLDDWLASPWLKQDLEAQVIAHAARTLVPEHYQAVKAQREALVTKTLAAVHERLVKEINYWTHRAAELQQAVSAGKQPRMQPENARRRAEDLTARLQARKVELELQRQVVSATPVVVGGALVIPQGLLAQRRGEPGQVEVDAEARARVEQLAMAAVMTAERALGFEPRDVSADKCGWDITSRTPDHRLRFIEVKGRVMGAPTVTVTRNEILCALNKPEQFILALVLVDGDQTRGPYYLRQPFTQEPDVLVTSWNLNLPALLQQAGPPA